MSNPQDRKSLAYREGLRAKRDGLKMEDTAIKNLKVGTRQYNEYLAGYHSLDEDWPIQMQA